ncbi:uncharacterized protein LOC113299641 [Papaver somniferum]|uniref:uncharacterized protein LOC113299641 n=1 Tax=Papaver somniferum TaxID=3469 RepID=UPI000E6FF4A0|nr:uncharacterized protein LOC113299641 [Papaver somniferum]XP_026404491.1 uncharacterized protein LOC113299641 [Papaver somniferum]XP_026404492.1 uncharacterized protein LOC113299641 [Papaver somniferum]
MITAATVVRDIHGVKSFVESAPEDNNGFEGVKGDVQGTYPYTDHIRQDDVVEVLEKMQEQMLTIKGGVIDVEIGKENMLSDKVLTVEEDGDAVVESPKLVEKHGVENPGTETGQNDQDSKVEEDGDAEAEIAKSNKEHCLPESLVVGALNTKCTLDGVKHVVDDHSPETSHVEDYPKDAVKVVSAKAPKISVDNVEEVIISVLTYLDNNLEQYGDAEVVMESSDNPVEEHGVEDPGTETAKISQVGNVGQHGDAEVVLESSDNPVEEHGTESSDNPGVEDPGAETAHNSQDGDAETESAKPVILDGVSDSVVGGALNTKCTLDGVMHVVDFLSRKVESDEEDHGLGPTGNKEDEPVDKVVEEEDDDAKINMTIEATEVRESHGVESLVNIIKENMTSEATKVMITTKGGDIDVEIDKEKDNMTSEARDKVLVVEEDADTKLRGTIT